MRPGLQKQLLIKVNNMIFSAGQKKNVLAHELSTHIGTERGFRIEKKIRALDDDISDLIALKREEGWEK